MHLRGLEAGTLHICSMAGGTPNRFMIDSPHPYFSILLFWNTFSGGSLVNVHLTFLPPRVAEGPEAGEARTDRFSSLLE